MQHVPECRKLAPSSHEAQLSWCNVCASKDVRVWSGRPSGVIASEATMATTKATKQATSKSATAKKSSGGKAYEKTSRCWPGYVPVPGKSEHEEGSCRPETAGKNGGKSVDRETARNKQIGLGGKRAEQARGKSPSAPERKTVSKAAKSHRGPTSAGTRAGGGSAAKKTAGRRPAAKKSAAAKSAPTASAARAKSQDTVVAASVAIAIREAVRRRRALRPVPDQSRSESFPRPEDSPQR